MKKKAYSWGWCRWRFGTTFSNKWLFFIHNRWVNFERFCSWFNRWRDEIKIWYIHFVRSGDGEL